MSVPSYNTLMCLIEKNPEFIFKDREFNGRTYRIFNYNLPSRTDFELPGALNCRGIMFDITGEAELVALPQKKFFTLKNNILKQYQDKVKRLFSKEDGSLISSWVDNLGNIQFKSKTMPRAVDGVYDTFAAMDDDLQDEIINITRSLITLDFEYVGPSNIHIINYTDDKLVLLRARSMVTGNDIDLYDSCFSQNYPKLYNILAQEIPNDTQLEDLTSRDYTEGVILETTSGELFKLKTDYYYSIEKLVNIQDNSKFLKRALTCVLEEGVDQACTIFEKRNNSKNYHGPETIKRLRSLDAAVDVAIDDYFKWSDDLKAIKFDSDKEAVAHIQSIGKAKYMNILMPIVKGKTIDLSRVLLTMYSDEFNEAINVSNKC